MADALHDRALGLLCNAIDHRITFIAITRIDANLDQLVCLQGQIDFYHHIIRQTVLTDDHDDFLMMGELAKLFELFLTDGHRAIINQACVKFFLSSFPLWFNIFFSH